MEAAVPERARRRGLASADAFRMSGGRRREADANSGALGPPRPPLGARRNPSKRAAARETSRAHHCSPQNRSVAAPEARRDAPFVPFSFLFPVVAVIALAGRARRERSTDTWSRRPLESRSERMRDSVVAFRASQMGPASAQARARALGRVRDGRRPGRAGKRRVDGRKVSRARSGPRGPRTRRVPRMGARRRWEAGREGERSGEARRRRGAGREGERRGEARRRWEAGREEERGRGEPAEASLRFEHRERALCGRACGGLRAVGGVPSRVCAPRGRAATSPPFFPFVLFPLCVSAGRCDGAWSFSLALHRRTRSSRGCGVLVGASSLSGLPGWSLTCSGGTP